MIRSTAFTSGLVPWASGDVCLFVVRHLLGVRFEGPRPLVLKPALYPHSPPVEADLRFRKGRLKLKYAGAGAVGIIVKMNGGQGFEPDPDGAFRLPSSSPAAAS